MTKNKEAGMENWLYAALLAMRNFNLVISGGRQEGRL